MEVFWGSVYHNESIADRTRCVSRSYKVMFWLKFTFVFTVLIWELENVPDQAYPNILTFQRHIYSLSRLQFITETEDLKIF